MNFNRWKDLVAHNPQKATDIFFQHLSTLDAVVRQAALTQTVERATVYAQFRRAAEAIDHPLAGIPYLLKDVFDVAGKPTLAGSTFLGTVRPPPKESSFLQKLLEEHRAVYCGKTQLNEFAYGLSGENPHYGDCPHPHVRHCLSGGSSSGSAWAVSAGLVPLAFGTDTGGSIRVPAAFCGIFGMRIPCHELSTQGVFPLSPSFDTVGWFTRNLTDIQAANSALINCLPLQDTPFRVLYLQGYAEPTARGLARGYDHLAKHLGAEVDPESNAWLVHSLTGTQAAYSILQSREAFEVHRTWLDNKKSAYDPVVWERIQKGRNWSCFELEKAQAKRVELRKIFADIFTQYDAILIPSTQTPSVPKSKLTAEFRQNLLKLTAPASMAKLPVLTLPIHLANRLSGGMQVLFPNLDRTNTVEILERSLDYYRH